jgi:hypothetical protein
MSEEKKSWILELRERLAVAPEGGAAGEPEEKQEEEQEVVRAALLVGLFVDAGRLAIALVVRTPEEGGEISVPWAELPGRMLPAGAPPWSAAARAGRDLLGCDPAAILELGTLAPLVDPARPDEEGVIVPCVGAIPWPIASAEGEDLRPLLALPILAYAGPKGVSQQVVEHAGAQRRVLTYEVLGHRIGGLSAAVLDDLVSRLGFGN